MKFIFKIIFAILKFVFRVFKGLCTLSAASYSFGMYDLDRFEENTKDL